MNKILHLSIFILLSGCASSGLDCARAGGVYCRSLSEVDEMISNGDAERLEIDQKRQRKFKIGKDV